MHLILNNDSIVFAGDTPWHGLGARMGMAQRFDVRAAFDLAKLHWEVELAEVFAGRAMTMNTARVAGHFAVVRKDTGEALAVVGDRYAPVQNSALAEAIDPIVAAGFATVETCGSLRNGRDVWALLKIADSKGVGPGSDRVVSYLLASNNHAGERCVEVAYTPVRVVCANTLAASQANRNLLGRVRHTASAQERLDRIAARVVELETTTAQLYARLASTPITEQVVVDMPKVMGWTQDGRTAKRVVELATSGRGNAGKTLWDLWQGMTEYETHESGRTAEARALTMIKGSPIAAKSLAWLSTLAVAA